MMRVDIRTEYFLLLVVDIDQPRQPMAWRGRINNALLVRFWSHYDVPTDISLTCFANGTNGNLVKGRVERAELPPWMFGTCENLLPDLDYEIEINERLRAESIQEKIIYGKSHILNIQAATDAFIVTWSPPITDVTNRNVLECSLDDSFSSIEKPKIGQSEVKEYYSNENDKLVKGHCSNLIAGTRYRVSVVTHSRFDGSEFRSFLHARTVLSMVSNVVVKEQSEYSINTSWVAAEGNFKEYVVSCKRRLELHELVVRNGTSAVCDGLVPPLSLYQVWVITRRYGWSNVTSNIHDVLGNEFAFNETYDARKQRTKFKAPEDGENGDDTSKRHRRSVFVWLTPLIITLAVLVILIVCLIARRKVGKLRKTPSMTQLSQLPETTDNTEGLKLQNEALQKSFESAVAQGNHQSLKTMLGAYKIFCKTNVHLPDDVKQDCDNSMSVLEKMLREQLEQICAKEKDKLLDAISTKDGYTIISALYDYECFMATCSKYIEADRELIETSLKAIKEWGSEAKRQAMLDEVGTLERRLSETLHSNHLVLARSQLLVFESIIMENKLDVNDYEIIGRATDTLKKRESEIETSQLQEMIFHDHVVLLSQLHLAIDSKTLANLSVLLKEYTSFCEANRSFITPDDKVIEAANKVIEFYDQTNLSLKQNISEAVDAKRYDELSSLIKQYRDFCENLSPIFTVDTSIIINAQRAIGEHEKHINDTHEQLKVLGKQLELAIETGLKLNIEQALMLYTEFVHEHADLLEVDPELVSAAHHVMQRIQEQEGIRTEFNYITASLNSACESECEYRIKEILDFYKVFAEKHRDTVVIDDSVLRKAEEAMELCRMVEKIRDAVGNRDRKALLEIIQLAEADTKRKKKLSIEIGKAKCLQDHLDNVDQLTHGILNLNRMTMLEIRDYSHPPPVVHKVMMAVMLILGDPECITKDWNTCQKLCVAIRSPTYPGLFYRIKGYELKLLRPEIAVRAKNLLEGLTESIVRDISKGALAFYKWVNGICDQCLLFVDTWPQEATGERQICMLRNMSERMSTDLNEKFQIMEEMVKRWSSARSSHNNSDA